MGPFHISCYVKDAVCISLPKKQEGSEENLRCLSAKRKNCLVKVSNVFCKNLENIGILVCLFVGT